METPEQLPTARLQFPELRAPVMRPARSCLEMLVLAEFADWHVAGPQAVPTGARAAGLHGMASGSLCIALPCSHL